MDFNDSPEEAAFRTEVREWLEINTKSLPDTLSRSRRQDVDEEELKIAREWQAKKADAGYAFIQWPEEYGGQGSAMKAIIYGQEESNYVVPRNVFGIGAFAGPTLMAYANEEQRLRYLPKLLRGEEIWCQLFSEPAAGSDLAGIRTRAIREGDEWVVNGQKVWTSGAHYSNYAILVTRHDTTVPKHMGLTYFFLSMDTPGVEVVPIKQISGNSDFCEVFLNDVHIPDSQRLGEVGDGWSVCLTTLMNERFNISEPYPPDAEHLLEMAQKLETEEGSALENAAVRERIADWYAQSRGVHNIHLRMLTSLSKGRTPGPEASIAKLINAPKLQEVGAYGMDLQEECGVLAREDAVDDGLFQGGFLLGPGIRIAGGTDEIMRNIIAERVLGMPGDIRVDKEVAFSQLPTSAQ